MTGRDDGSAVVEFVWLAVLLMVPLVYVVITAVSLQRSAFAITEAARDAGRAYATAGSDRLGERRAEQAVALALRDQGIRWRPSGRVVSCGRCAYAPGSAFTVTLRTRVALALVPHWMCGHVCVAGIPVSARHSERISCYAGTGPPAPGAPC
jgi:hypothetical protein